MSNCLSEHYRCPEDVNAIELPPNLPEGVGYFQFGDDAVCYGQCSAGIAPEPNGNELPNALDAARFLGSRVRLPFDPSEIIANLRFERYQNAAKRNQNVQYEQHPIGRRLYYLVRPFIPAGLRRVMQRAYFAEWQKIKFPRWPLDTTVENVLERLLLLSMQSQNIGRIPFIWFWPEGMSSCAIVTHDVETVVGREFCSTLMDLNDSFAIKASFQIVPQLRYSISDSFLGALRERGFEINVQDLNHDGLLFSSRDKFARRVEQINRYAKEYGAKGFRAAVLYRNLDWYADLDFAYDMSVPNVGHLEPQRGGCCTVFPYFVGNILELPLTTTQDYTLFHILKTYSIDLWVNQIELIMERHGLISFIIHPDYIAFPPAFGSYRALLTYLSSLRSEKRLWICTPGQVNDWWRQRSQMMLVQSENGWSIQGPGSQRARLAYAVLKDNKLQYELATPCHKGEALPQA